MLSLYSNNDCGCVSCSIAAVGKQVEEHQLALNEALLSLRAELATAHERETADREVRHREAIEQEKKRHTEEMCVVDPLRIYTCFAYLLYTVTLLMFVVCGCAQERRPASAV